MSSAKASCALLTWNPPAEFFVCYQLFTTTAILSHDRPDSVTPPRKSSAYSVSFSDFFRWLGAQHLSLRFASWCQGTGCQDLCFFCFLLAGDGLVLYGSHFGLWVWSCPRCRHEDQWRTNNAHCSNIQTPQPPDIMYPLHKRRGRS